jgi:hypothetical protein
VPRLAAFGPPVHAPPVHQYALQDAFDRQTARQIGVEPAVIAGQQLSILEVFLGLTQPIGYARRGYAYDRYDPLMSM